MCREGRQPPIRQKGTEATAMKALLAVLAASAVLSTATLPAQAEGFRDLMEDLGVQKRKQYNIDYSERAPLVLPPSTDMLPPPEDSGSLAAVNPNWPTDPDEAAAAKLLEEEKIPQHLRRKYKENKTKEIYKFNAQAREERGAEQARAYDTNFDRNKVLSPQELKEVRDERANAAPAASAYVEPERKRLTDPPPGYRTPSPAQPFGPGEKEQARRSGWLSKLNPFD